MLDRLPDELMLRLCVASDRAPHLLQTSRAVRAAMPPRARPEEAYHLNHAAAGDELVSDVWSECGEIALRRGTLVRVGRRSTAAGGPLDHQMCELHAALRTDQTGAALDQVARGALGAGHPVGRRVRALRYLAWLGDLFSSARDSITRNLSQLGLDCDARVCREALAIGLGRATDWGATIVVLAGATDTLPDVDGRKAAAMGVILSAAVGRDALADGSYRVAAVSACIDGGVPRSLACLLRGVQPYLSSHEVASYVVRAAEGGHEAVLVEMLAWQTGPASTEGRGALGRALTIAAENDDLPCCRAVLCHPWVDATLGRAHSGAALVACCRLNRLRAAEFLCDRDLGQRDVDRALETTAHWRFSALAETLLSRTAPSARAIGRGLWTAALHGDCQMVGRLRAALGGHWDESRRSVQLSVDQALDAATSARSADAARALLTPGGPTPSAGAQADALRSACFAGDRELVQAILTEPLARTMNRNTLNACFLESARRHDLPTVRALLPLVGDVVVAEGLRGVMLTNDVEMTSTLLRQARREVAAPALQRAVVTALTAGVGSTIHALLEVYRGRPVRATLLAAIAAAVPSDLHPAAPQYQALAALVRAGDTDLLDLPGVWRVVVATATVAGTVDVLRAVVGHGPPDPSDPRDTDAACAAMECAIKSGNVDVIETLAGPFAMLAGSDAVDHAFVVAVAWAVDAKTPALHILARHFCPSRTAIRRCRMLLAPLDARRAAEIATLLSNLARPREAKK
jgi:hypothetical protein